MLTFEEAGKGVNKNSEFYLCNGSLSYIISNLRDFLKKHCA